MKALSLVLLFMPSVVGGGESRLMIEPAGCSWRVVQTLQFYPKHEPQLVPVIPMVEIGLCAGGELRWRYLEGMRE